MMKKSKIILASLAGIIAISLTTIPVIAYFTAHTEAEGNVSVQLGTQTTIVEEFEKDDPLIKLVTIENTGKEDVYVRATAYSAYPLEITGGDSWQKGADGDVYYYYTDVLEPEQKTVPPLRVKVTPPANASPDSFNVIIVYESTRAIYDENGNLTDPVWPEAEQEGGES